MSSVFTLPTKILLYCNPVDLRQGYNKLLGIVRQDNQHILSSDALYIFCNKSKSLLKGLYWDRTGYIVFSKRLETGAYSLPNGIETKELDAVSLRLLLDGLKIFLKS